MRKDIQYRESRVDLARTLVLDVLLYPHSCAMGEKEVFLKLKEVQRILGGGTLHLSKLDNLDEQIRKKIQEQVKIK